MPNHFSDIASNYQMPTTMEPEQKWVLDLITERWSGREFVLVQGVAGSGKTTIALHALRRLAEHQGHLIEAGELTPTLVTYNEYLVRFCRKVLSRIDSVAAFLGEEGNPQTGRINIITFRELCALLADEETKSRFLDDMECINLVADIAADRNIRGLLPSQIFALITAFLKGRLDLRGMTYDQVKEHLNRSSTYTIYRDTLLKVRKLVIKTYENKLGNRCDRADLSKTVLDALHEDEERFDLLKKTTAQDIRKNTRHTLGDENREHRELIRWLVAFCEDIAQLATMEKEAEKVIGILKGISLNNKHWCNIRDKIIRWTKQYGLRGTYAFRALKGRLRHPLIIVDEVQDLSQIECNVLISLWFHLTREDPHNRLIMLGDLNQQMMPTGFRWNEVITAIDKQCRRYDYDRKKFNPNLGFIAAESRSDSPFLILMNNYRTTEEIARFASEMITNIAPKVFGKNAEKEMRACVENCIDPGRTLPIQIEEAYKQIPEEDRIPRIVVVDQKYFLDGLRMYLSGLCLEEDDKEWQKIVVIAADDTGITQMVQEDNTLFRALAYNPILSCKGLEFNSCAIFGLPTKADGSMERDVLGQWYTACTRARLKMVIFLDEAQMDYLRQAGWNKISAGTAIVINAAQLASGNGQAGVVADFLARIGTEKLEPETMKVAGEAHLERFRRSMDEAFLMECLRYFDQGNWESEAENARLQAARIFEKHERYKRAIYWYRRVGDRLAVVRCAKRLMDAIRRSADKANENENKEKLEEMESLVHRQIMALKHAGRFKDATKACEIVQKYGLAAKFALKAGDPERAERNVEKLPTGEEKTTLGKRVMESYIAIAVGLLRGGGGATLWGESLRKAERAAGGLPQSERDKLYHELAKLYLQGDEESWAQAYRLYAFIDDRKRAEEFVNRMAGMRKYDVVARGYLLADDHDGLRSFAERLMDEREFEAAADFFERISLFNNSASCWMKAANFWDRRINSLIGIRMDREPERWFMIGFRTWLESMRRKATRYGAEKKKILELERYIRGARTLDGLDAANAERIRNIVANVQADVVMSQEWNRDLRRLVRNLETRIKECGLNRGLPEEALADAKKIVKAGLREEQIGLLRTKLKPIVTTFKVKAERVVEKVLQTKADDRHVKAVRGLSIICRNKKKALRHIDELWSKGEERLRMAAVRCWTAIEEKETARTVVDSLDVREHAAFIRSAYDIIYPDDRSARNQAKEELKKRIDLMEAENRANGAGEPADDKREQQIKGRVESMPARSDERRQDNNDAGRAEGERSSEALKRIRLSMTDLENEIAASGMEDENERKKIMFDLKFIRKKIESGTVEDGEEQWKLTRKLIAEACSALQGKMGEIDKYWKMLHTSEENTGKKQDNRVDVQ